MAGCGAIHDFLDAPSPAAAGRLRRHAESCAACRPDVPAALALAALPELPGPHIPQALTDKWVAAVAAGRPAPAGRRWIAGAVVLALAASLFLVVWAGSTPRPGTPAGVPTAAKKSPRPAEPKPAPRGRGDTVSGALARAGSSVRGLARSVGKLEWPSARLPELTQAPSLEPNAARPLRELRDGASLALAPVRRSARRALSIFWGSRPPAGG